MGTEGIKYSIELVDEISAKLKKINRGLRENGAEFGSTKTKAQGMGNSLATTAIKFAGLTAAVLATKKAISFTIRAVSDFSGASAKLRAIVQPSKKDFESLEQAALKYGSTTAFTASQVMDAYTEQAKLGQTVNEILASGSAVLDLAAMSQIGLAEAAAITTQTLNQFSLDADQTNRVVDVMAKAFTSSALDAQKFSGAMEYVGTIGSVTGNTIEEVSGSLGILADRAIESGMAGRAVRRMMIELADSSSKAAKTVEATGSGAKTFTEKLKVLKGLNLNLSDTVDLFGTLSATAATVLIGAADDVDTLTKSLEGADGTGKQMAETMLDSLPGAAIKMNSALEGLALTTKDVLEPALKAAALEVAHLANGLTEFMRSYNPTKYMTLVELEDERHKKMTQIAKLSIQIAKNEKEKIPLVRAGLALQNMQSRKTIENLQAEIDKINEVVSAKRQAGMAVGKTDTGGGSTTTTAESVPSAGASEIGTFKAPKVPVSYFEEMATKYQEQAEFKFTVDEQIREKDAEMQEQQKSWSEERTAMYIEENRKRIELQKTYISTSVEAAQTISNGLFTIGRQRANHEKKQQIERIKNSTKSEAEKAKAIEAIERQEFEKNKKRSIAQAILNGALGATKTIANTGFPAAIPMLVLQGAALAVSIATIASQKFAKGGIVQKEVGKPMTGDKHLISANPGEMVLTKDQQKGLGQTVVIGDTQIIIQGNVDENSLAQIDQTIEDKNESLRQSILELSETGRIGGVTF